MKKFIQRNPTFIAKLIIILATIALCITLCDGVRNEIIERELEETQEEETWLRKFNVYEFDDLIGEKFEYGGTEATVTKVFKYSKSIHAVYTVHSAQGSSVEQCSVGYAYFHKMRIK